ncbi:DrmB family protein [Coleofasciculus chthonoplastes]|uniref:DrmB family protein n=1 Tax=Coleofasciculus chthonoplastes TaxID=64178 RepID=UPI0032F73AE1
MNQSNYSYKVGELRPSQILFSFGIGAIADLPNLSVMIMGLEDWDKNRGIELAEERLLAAVRGELGQQVKQLKAPPIPPDEQSSTLSLSELSRIGIPVAPFPSWMVCPKCRLLAPLQSGFFTLKPNPYRPDKTCYVHKNCRRTIKPPPVIPARFLVACEHGHLDDFPWMYFVHRGNIECKGSLRLEELGVSGSATDIVVKCNGCDTPPRRLSDAFGESGKKNMPRCRGRHPHLRSFDDSCDQQMKSILLGASNSWFGITLSALSIPTASSQLGQLVEQYWTALSKATSPEILNGILTAMQAMGQLQEFAQYPLDEIWVQIEQRQTGQEDIIRAGDLKTPEWEIFSQADPTKNTKEFQLDPVAPPKGYEHWFNQAVLVKRLREVRALIGFTRIQSPGDFADAEEIPDDYQVCISRHSPQWVPTTEVKGEGIFLEFQESVLKAWEERPPVKKHEQRSREAHKNWCNVRSLDPDKVRFPGIRYMLLHSFSHALMRQLAIECGYNAASLRERIYSRPPEDENGSQAGLLIYTAAPDSEGTLGGLVNLGQPAILGHHIAQALEQMRLCSSDPLCAEHAPLSGTASLHWAACHACLFSPETSCERGNKYLDRALLIPTVQLTDLAFFQ